MNIRYVVTILGKETSSEPLRKRVARRRIRAKLNLHAPGKGIRLKARGEKEYGVLRDVGEGVERLFDVVSEVGEVWHIKAESDDFAMSLRMVEVIPPIQDTLGTHAVDVLYTYVFSKYPNAANWGICNCRRIDGSSTWSNHAWCNALDIGGSVSLLDVIAADLRKKWEQGVLPIAELLWRVSGHYNHIHLTGDPKQYGTPPCAS